MEKDARRAYEYGVKYADESIEEIVYLMIIGG